MLFITFLNVQKYFCKKIQNNGRYRIDPSNFYLYDPTSKRIPTVKIIWSKVLVKFTKKY